MRIVLVMNCARSTAMSDYDEPKQKIAAIQQRLNNTAYEIRTNRSLNAQGKQREIARATLDARRSADKLRAELVAQREKRRAELGRILFGAAIDAPHAELMALSDARDRAGRLESREPAAAMLRDAFQSCDTTLAKAVGRKAFDKGWDDVASQYADQWDKRVFLDRLNETNSGPMTNMADSAVFKIHSPDEIRSITYDTDLQSLAEMEVAE
jgi:hypothetical protein